MAKAGLRGEAPESWFARAPSRTEAWRARAESIRNGAMPGWLEQLRPAILPTGLAAERLTNAADGRGVVVTTGQQPGLFGGPLYTWTKALTALALADELEAAIGIPVAPVFWAATDDSDFAEGAWTCVNVPGGYRRLQLTTESSPGVSVGAIGLDIPDELLAAFADACGSGADLRALDAVRRTYRQGTTVGGAYLDLLRELLSPLGVSVIDASHPAVRIAAHPLYVTALKRHEEVHQALLQRSAAIRTAGYEPQVAEVEDLTLVFGTHHGHRARIPRKDAETLAASATPGSLSPNVLLRPVAERYLLPTMAYAAGPGEFAYFAQVSVVAQALEAAPPLAVPRWSATIVEPHIERLLSKYNLTVEELAQPHDVARRLSQDAIPHNVTQAVAEARSSLARSTDAMREAVRAHQDLVPERTVEAIERVIMWRLERFERRLRAGVRRRDTTLSRDLGTLGGALYPDGLRQERALNLIPLLVRHGLTLFDLMLREARAHARALVNGSRDRAA